jgi:Domain of unknown function (DUF4177)
MDVRFNCPHCSQHLAVDETGAGMTVNCPSCNRPVEVPRSAAPPPPVPIPVPALQQATASSKAKRKEIDVKEYKVLTQKDRFFGGKFDPERLEKAINSYATEGWSVVSVATASIPSLTGTREEMIVVMEREK